ncbi:TIGR04438 family Trp-rich protein [Tepidimonas charontis]|uniref:Small Trp-rich protein n=1 Tax=Tepidimonas charontis TaxID=2267262 RepID=A0A554XGK6_9BURK|nr:TIGR04438 family Trp-rich protein [Tepidimonas charontis]TSE34919.1 small Trp-rich protein [Tepidimonas charontis]
MAFLLVGVVLLALKWGGVEPVAGLDWGWVAAPFGAAVLWWWWADWSGYTQRKAMEKEAARKAKREAKARRALRLPPSRV